MMVSKTTGKPGVPGAKIGEIINTALNPVLY